MEISIDRLGHSPKIYVIHSVTKNACIPSSSFFWMVHVVEHRLYYLIPFYHILQMFKISNPFYNYMDLKIIYVLFALTIRQHGINLLIFNSLLIAFT